MSETALAREAALIDARRAAPWPVKQSHGDTVWMGAIDAKGLAVSYIQSIYWEYGSGCVLPATGIHWQNRGTSFSLDPAAVNPLQPGRKPFHTLNPALARFSDGRVLAYGSMGGDGQPQFQAQILTRYRLGQNLAEAVDAPRWLYTPIYIALGWAAVFFIPGFFRGATDLGLGVGIAVFTLIVAGGALYTLGGVVYGFKRPNPWPRWFGFHEVFHTFTILAFVSHYVGVSLATYSLR